MYADGKIFNLDGPDDIHYYRHDLRKVPDTFSKPVQGNGSVMVWGATSFSGKLDLFGIERKKNSVHFNQILEHALLSISKRLIGEDWILQQDNANVHTSRHPNEFLDFLI